MKRILLIAAALAIVPSFGLKAQAPQPVPAAPLKPAAPAAPKVAELPKAVIQINLVPHLKDPIQQLQAIKAANQAQLDKQAKTLQALDALQKQAEELKFFGKRS
jgi:hypothetical protein